MEQLGQRNLPCRFKFTKGINDCDLIQVHTSNKLSDLDVALNVLSNQQEGKERVVILSDIIHDEDTTSKRVYQELQVALQEKKVSHIIGVGVEIQKYAEVFTAINKSFYTKVEDLFGSAIYTTFSNAVILVSNASNPEMMRIVGALELHSDRAVLNTNLDAIKHNLDFFRSKLQKPTKLLAVLKASSYGTGDYELASLLQHQGVDYFAVAYTIEGIWLRTHGVITPIIVFNPTIESFDKVIHYNLEPAIYTLPMLCKLNEFVIQHGKYVNIHIKLETGMYQHGINANELDDLIRALSSLSPYVVVKGIYSHLVGQSKPAHDEFTEQQANKFIAMATRIEKELEITAIKHLLATGGIVRFPAYHFDMVRLGGGLFGLCSNGAVANQLQEVMTLETRISQVIRVPKGSTVGYDRSYVALHDMSVAVIDIGYADGFNKSLGKGVGIVWIGSESARTIGNICMDKSTIDVTGIDVNAGDTVTIFGNSISTYSLASAAGADVYEMLTNLHHRVKRVVCATSLVYKSNE